MTKEVRRLYYGLAKADNPDLEKVEGFELEADFSDEPLWLAEADAKGAALAIQTIIEGPDNPKEGETVYYVFNIKESDSEGNLYVRWENSISLTRGLNNGGYSVD